MQDAGLRNKVERCYQEVMLRIQRIGEGMQEYLKARKQLGGEGSFMINGAPVDAEMMVGALEAYAFERPTHHGITLFLQWNTERGEERIRAALEGGIKFLRGIPFCGFDENNIDDAVWEFIGGNDHKKDDQLSRIQVLQTAAEADMGARNCHGMGSCGR